MADEKSTSKSPAVPVKATEWVVDAVANLSAADAFSALNQIVDAVRDSIQIHQTESTKRERVIAYRDMEVARIKSMGIVFLESVIPRIVIVEPTTLQSRKAPALSPESSVIAGNWPSPLALADR